MKQSFKEKIPYLNEAQKIVPIHKGFSSDEKYVIDDRYLIRLFASEGIEERQEEFQTIKKLAIYSYYVPEALDFNSIPETGQSYMLLTYLPGHDGEAALKELTEPEQYKAGIQAGDELKKLHKFQAPPETTPWYEQKKKKSDNYLNELMKIPVNDEIKQLLETYIHENDHLMKKRPNTFQHDDFHPANLLIHNRKFSGIIDFQRIDWGDPLHDLTKLGFFSVRVSVPFSIGIIDGYFSPHKPNNEFWELYCLYSAMHVVSSLVWGLRLGEEHFKRLLKYSKDVITDHKNFTQTIPSWYDSKGN